MPPFRNYQDRLPSESDDFEKTWNEASLPSSKSETQSQMDQNAAEAIAILRLRAGDKVPEPPKKRSRRKRNNRVIT